MRLRTIRNVAGVLVAFVALPIAGACVDGWPL